MAEVISGKELSLKKRDFMKNQVEMLENKYGRKPHLAVILVGDDPGSVSYVTGKEKACNEIGITNTTIKKPNDITQEELLEIIEELNNNKSVDGILVQLPLPKHINQTFIINSIRPDKDVDGFHPVNVASLYLKQPGIIPCTPKGIMEVLDSVNISIEGKRAVVIGRSNIVGLPVSKLMLDRNATITIAHSRTKDLASVTKEADILIAAVGKPLFVKRDMVKEGAVVIDVGVNRNPETGKLCGDVDFNDVLDKVSYITKVPGGIGPMTITCLMENTIECFIKHVEN
ncbi:MAG: bifunctional methylenetetrahydrofolate dehydrogenase/methenyltetrahydrofolate cyclohydrolase FolD [Anaeroplasma sp.]|nr:bifunctional methylenetetrahydrofolate dehydrogenase/methenyltetrahydrofolate cyclohydrolase FolD [Anaeroplasma sp.]